MPPNVWPEEVELFKATFLELFAAFDRTGAKLLEAIARYLDLAPDYFVDTVKDGNSILRLLHYPPIPGDGPNVRAGAHEDINTITLLLGAEEAGLQLLDRDGDWLPVTPKPGELAVNIGDMLQRLTNNVTEIDHPPGGEPAARAARRLALLDALLPPLPLGFPDRDAAQLHLGGAARTSIPSRSPRTNISRSGCGRSSWPKSPASA